MRSSTKGKIQLLLAFATLLLVAFAAGCRGFFVNATLQTITVAPQTPSIQQGKTQQMSATGTFNDGSTKDLTGKASWSSSDSATASVSTTGLVTGNALGTATITATSATISGSTTVTITLANIQSITVTPTDVSILEGQTQQYDAVATTSDGTQHDITSTAQWASSNTNAATINATGLATAATTVTSAQQTTISATSGGVTGSTTLTVNP
jgi:uncharacterized protein YjdB